MAEDVSGLDCTEAVESCPDSLSTAGPSALTIWMTWSMGATAKQEATEKTLPARWHLPIPAANKLGCRSQKATSKDCVLAKGKTLPQD